MKLNVGAGRNPLPGWHNLDRYRGPGIDTDFDLEDCRIVPLPFPDSVVSEFLLSHVIEHVHNVLPLMEELWRIANPGAKMTIRCPYGASDDAWEDPTHVRRMFPNSFLYFGQGMYWRADYGYGGDWAVKRVTLTLREARPTWLTPQDVLRTINRERNVVQEMVAELVAVKPAREPKKENQDQYEVVLERAR
jgi:SAM-dependent methyltransferase